MALHIAGNVPGNMCLAHRYHPVNSRLSLPTPADPVSKAFTPAIFTHFPPSVLLLLLCRWPPSSTTEKSEVHKQPVSFRSTLRSTQHFHTKSFLFYFFPISSKLWVKQHPHFPHKVTAARRGGFCEGIARAAPKPKLHLHVSFLHWPAAASCEASLVVFPKPDEWKQHEPGVTQMTWGPGCCEWIAWLGCSLVN